jgi:hypothetical protein
MKIRIKIKTRIATLFKIYHNKIILIYLNKFLYLKILFSNNKKSINNNNNMFILNKTLIIIIIMIIKFKGIWEI